MWGGERPRNWLIALSRWSLNASINVSFSQAGSSWDRKVSPLGIVKSSTVTFFELSKLPFRGEFHFPSDSKQSKTMVPF